MLSESNTVKNEEELSEKEEKIPDESISQVTDNESPEVVSSGEGIESEGDPEESEEENTTSVLSTLESELEEIKDQVLRHQAEAQNVKRRADQDVEKARKYALERFCNELLPVVDSLEMAISSRSSDDDDSESIIEGVQLTLKMLVDTLAKFNLEQIDPEGEPFDPKMHQAVSLVENKDVEPNTVLSVMQRGYMLSGRLIRPAMVMVSKAPE